MNIAEILKDCPKGTKLYSPLFGEVKLDYVTDDIEDPIHCVAIDGRVPLFMSDGRYFGGYCDAECMLFPSKDQRDWSKFVVPGTESAQSHQFNPFDKVLVRDSDDKKWVCDFFEGIPTLSEYEYSSVLRGLVHRCIPYEGNEHLLGTKNKPE